MNEGCGCMDPGDITFLSIGGRRTGVNGLSDMFNEWREGNRSPEDISAAEILGALRRQNYIAESVEEEYVEEVRRKYREFSTGGV